MMILKLSITIGLLVLSMSSTIAKEIVSDQRCDVIDIQLSKEFSEKQKRAEIYQLLDDWKRAVDNRDIKQIVNLVTDDAEFWTHGAHPLIGREALKQAFEPFLAKYEFTQNYKCYELIIRDNVAFLRGLEQNTKKPRLGGEEIITEQRAFSVLRQSDDGVWRFSRGMTNLPVQK